MYETYKPNRTYPPPTNDICCQLSSSFEVLAELISRPPCSVVLLLNCLHGIEKKGATIMIRWFRSRRAACLCLDVSPESK
jgi:hypothetical protein